MSRKTRRLIWSAPLVAVLAVAGALAIFAALAPNAAQATHETLPGAPTNLLVKPASGNDARTSLVLTWTAPENSSVTGYRIDYSMDNVVYKELVANSASTATTHTHTGLDSGKMYIYRVFAINNAGTGPVSETYSNTTLGTAGMPDDVTGLTAARAATTPEKWSQIDLSWTEPYGGGKKITGYCIEFVDNAATTSWPNDDAGCRVETPAEVEFSTGTAAGVILTGNAMTKYEHEMQPAGTRRYYRVFAMTSDTAVSEMPSNEASAITAARENPMPPGTLRAAKNEAGTAVNLYWYWPDSNGGMDIANFRVEVTTNESNWPEPSETVSDNDFDGSTVTNADGTTLAVHDEGVLPLVAVAGTQSRTATAQTTHTHAVPAAVTNKRLYYRVFTETGTDADNDVLRSGYSNTASVVLNGGSNPTMPIFSNSDDLDTGATGGDGEIDLAWKAGLYDDPDDDPDAGETVNFPASGYRIDYAIGMGDADDGSQDLLRWKSLWGNTGFSDTRFTHQSLKPETRVYYRVFAIGSAQTISAAAGPENAETEEAGALGKVQNVRAVADNSTQITVTWDRPMDTSASDIKQYNVQMKMLGTADPTEFDPDATDGPTATESGSVTTYPHKSLSESETWLYRVAAVKVGRTDNPIASEYTAWVTATTPEAGKPDMPIGLVAENARDSNLTAVGARGVLLIWNMPKGPAGSMVGMYKIERKVMGKDSDYKALGMTTGIRTTYTDPDEPDDGEMRYYRVAAVSKTSVEGEWAEVRFPVDTMMLPGKPTLTAMKDADMPGTKVKLTWEAPAMYPDRVTGYIIERRHAGDMMGDIPSDGYNAGVMGASHAFMDYKEWWETLNCKGMLAVAGSSASVTATEGESAQDTADRGMYCKHFANTAPTNMAFAGTTVTEETAMKIKEMFMKRYVTDDMGKTKTMFTGMMHTDMGLMENTEYTYRVRAIHGMKAGMWSDKAMVTTGSDNSDPMKVGTIPAVTVEVGETSDPMDVSMYFSDTDTDTLTYRAMSDRAMFATAAVSGSMLTITGVAEGMAIITVYASDSKGGTEAMQTIKVTVTAADTTLGPPSGVELTDGTTDPDILTIDVEWTNGQNALSHLVLLFDTSDYSIAGTATRQDDGMTSFSNLDPGTYLAVVVAYDAEGGVLLAISGLASVGG